MRQNTLSNRCLLTLLFLLGNLITTVAQTADRTIRIQAITGMQFDKVQLTALPGETIRFVLVNKDEMGHNFLITQPGQRQAIVEAALALAEKGPERNFIPISEAILGSLPVVYPGDSTSFIFKVPTQAGAYPYVCTYPGHGSFMYGVLYVGKDVKVPAADQDVNIPEIRRVVTPSVTTNSTAPKATVVSASKEESALHPYEMLPPFLYRVFIEGSSLASIAVRLPKELAFCWDATACKLQFAWSGDFLDNTDFWHGHKNAYSKVLGTVFFRDKTAHPLRIGNRDAIPTVVYKGYRLINRYPEFHYLVNGYEVKELIKEKEEGAGIIREFKITGGIEPVWFVFDGNDGVRYESLTGKVTGTNQILYSPQEATSFSIHMTR